MHKVTWYVKRLRVMGGRELMRRLEQYLQLKILQIQYELGIYGRKYKKIDDAKLTFLNASEAQLPQLPFAPQLDAATISARLRGDCSALGGTWCWKADPDIWHRAPDTGRYWPKVFFGKVDYREGNPHGDVRVAWEPARMQQLVELALIARQCFDARTAAITQIKSQLTTWLDTNPPGCGIHYISVMECALRLIAICYTVDLVRPHILGSRGSRRAVASIVWSHAELIQQRLSRDSSSGNHTIAECAGLVYAGILFPEVPGAPRWGKTGLDMLRKEAARQVLDDGGGIEQSPWYHLFVVDLLGLVEQLLRCKELPVPTEISESVRRGRTFISTVSDSSGRLPGFGDADGGYALSRWLRLSFDSEKAIATDVVSTFPSTGMTVARLAGEGGDLLFFDHGPLGMPPLCGHGHADALSVILRLGGQDFLIDPGTFTYTGEQRWRRYFRGTRAHNTVTVEGRDQGCQETAFMWSRPYAAALVWSDFEDERVVRLLAKHDGYADMGVVHWRGITIIRGETVFVWDRLDASAVCESELNWHIAAEVRRVSDNSFSLVKDGRVTQLLIEGGSTAAHTAEDEPIKGWNSPQYGEKVPATTLSTTYRGEMPHEFTTIFRLHECDHRSTDVDADAEAAQFRALAHTARDHL